MRTKFLIMILVAALLACDDSGDPTALTPGKAGSLARFAMSATYLYAVDEQSLNVYKINSNGALEKRNQTQIGVNVETIFIKDNNLYIGTQDAMSILDISNPEAPQYQSRYNHIVACDPVVVQDTLAFVTFRTSECRTMGANALEIINIKDPTTPIQLCSYTLTAPYGLGVDGNLLFVCEGNDGLKVFNVTNPAKPTIIGIHDDIHAYDVIIEGNGKMILTGKDGVSQYSYTPSGDMQKLSHISIQQ